MSDTQQGCPHCQRPGFDGLATRIARFQAILAASGNAPEIEGALLKQLVKMMLADASDRDRIKFDNEIDAYLEIPKDES